MKLLGILRLDYLVNFLNFIGIPLAVLYAFCMFVWPFISGSCSWGYVQDVWDRWQSLNVGMLALVSSIIALNISSYNAEKQRNRDFLAAKTFLPMVFSELISYFKDSAKVLRSCWSSNNEEGDTLKIPELPREYKSIFQECIRHAEPNVGEYLANINVWLQIHDARIRSYVEHHADKNYINPDKHNLITLFYRLGELQALVSKLFEFARSMGEFDSSPLKWEDFRNAYFNLDILVEDIRIDDLMNLEGFTKREISRNGSSFTP